jgi:hypothetical protein
MHDCLRFCWIALKFLPWQAVPLLYFLLGIGFALIG